MSGEGMSLWANVLVVDLIPFEVRPRPGAILAIGFVAHRNERDDPALFDQSREVRGRAVGGVSGKPIRLDAKAFFCAIQHGLRGADLGLAVACVASTSIITENLPYRYLEKDEWPGTLPFKPNLQNHRYARLRCTSWQTGCGGCLLLPRRRDAPWCGCHGPPGKEPPNDSKNRRSRSDQGCFSGSRDIRDGATDIQQEDKARQTADFLRDLAAMRCRHEGPWVRQAANPPARGPCAPQTGPPPEHDRTPGMAGPAM